MQMLIKNVTRVRKFDCEILFLSLINCMDKIDAWMNKTRTNIQLIEQIILLM